MIRSGLDRLAYFKQTHSLRCLFLYAFIHVCRINTEHLSAIWSGRGTSRMGAAENSFLIESFSRGVYISWWRNICKPLPWLLRKEVRSRGPGFARTEKRWVTYMPERLEEWGEDCEVLQHGSGKQEANEKRTTVILYKILNVLLTKYVLCTYKIYL